MLNTNMRRGALDQLANKRNAQKEKEPGKNNVLKTNKKNFEKEVTLRPDTFITVSHGRNNKKLIVTAKTKEGKAVKVKYKAIDNNKIKVYSTLDTTITLKLTVEAKPKPDDQKWYKTAQVIARGLMMVRSLNLSYRNQYSMSVPGFLPNIGNMFGQRSGDILSPGLDFAFGLVGDDYINKSAERGWLLMADSVSTPANTSLTEDVQLRMTLEPVKNLKIDLNASRTETKARSIQYMYQGMPTTQSGTLTMTTLSLGSAFEGTGNANNGYHSATFDKFCNSLETFRNRVEAQYANATYPEGTTLAGKPFDANNGSISKYSSDVMIPAFLSAYTSMGGHSLSIFPALSKMLPNWSIKYSGLGNLPWFKDVFKSVNLNHAYKSIYAVGSYSSYSTYMEYMNGLGFVTDATTGNPVPSSMYNVSTVSINEAFSPLLGIDLTFQNNLTCKLEYRTTRVLSLSMTSIQISEASSHDWVVGMGYKINDFKLFGGSRRRTVKQKNKKGNGNNNTQQVSSQSSSSRTRGSSFNSDLNLRLDLSLRKQASIVRDIASMTSSASSGNTAFKLSFSADYTLSRLLTMSFYYDRQTNTPLLSSSSYPTTTQDFGLSLKFSLTR